MTRRTERRARLEREAKLNQLARTPCATCNGKSFIVLEAKGCVPCTSSANGWNIPGIHTAGVREILQHEANQPLRGGRAELQNAGLFGDGAKQKEMF